jgi:hypothetical protein
MFDQMYNYFKLHSAPYMMACRRVVTHPILMSIIFQQHKQLTTLMDQQNVNDKEEKVRYPFVVVGNGKINAMISHSIFRGPG